jgi:hypothetical protein
MFQSSIDLFPSHLAEKVSPKSSIIPTTFVIRTIRIIFEKKSPKFGFLERKNDLLLKVLHDCTRFQAQAISFDKKEK